MQQVIKQRHKSILFLKKKFGRLKKEQRRFLSSTSLQCSASCAADIVQCQNSSLPTTAKQQASKTSITYTVIIPWAEGNLLTIVEHFRHGVQNRAVIESRGDSCLLQHGKCTKAHRLKSASLACQGDGIVLFISSQPQLPQNLFTYLFSLQKESQKHKLM